MWVTRLFLNPNGCHLNLYCPSVVEKTLQSLPSPCISISQDADVWSTPMKHGFYTQGPSAYIRSNDSIMKHWKISLGAYKSLIKEGVSCGCSNTGHHAFHSKLFTLLPHGYPSSITSWLNISAISLSSVPNYNEGGGTLGYSWDLFLVKGQYHLILLFYLPLPSANNRCCLLQQHRL